MGWDAIMQVEDGHLSLRFEAEEDLVSGSDNPWH